MHWTRLLLFIFLISLLGTLSAQDLPGYYVEGRHLYDPCGEKVILRGVANPNFWFEKDGGIRYEEIEKTGANVVRIVWETSGSAEQLNLAIQNCIDMEMIPMVECHDATCDLDLLDEVVDYWVSPEIVNVIIEHEEYLLLNIANEAGDYATTATPFRDAYETAILRLREANIHVPLVIDGPDCGKNINILQSVGPYLISVDPDSNLIFSVHMWWNQKTGYPESLISQEIEQSVNMNLPLIVGEFGCWFDWESNEVTPATTIPYLTIIMQCHLNEIGYIAWSWFGNNNDILDMSDGTYDTLHDWGLEVAVTDTYSIANTAVRSYFLTRGHCAPNRVEPRKNELPSRFHLTQNYPNPFNSSTRIQYTISDPALVTLTIYDLSGKKVKTLMDGFKPAGVYNIGWTGINDSGTSIASGMYIYEATVRQNLDVIKQTRQMLHVK
jgi:mannan endo-1,4-beta-mannosidase